MRHFPFAYPRAQMQAQVLERLEAGMTERILERQPGYPSRQTLYRWTKDEPGFALRLRAARAMGRGVRHGAKNTADGFDEGRAQAFLLRVRRGDAVRDLVRMAGQPNREVLNLWKRLRPDFAAELAAAARFSFEERDKRMPFDQAVADRIICAVSAGAVLSGDPLIPSKQVLRRWRALRPGFAAALDAAKRFGHRARMAAGRRSTPELTEAIAAHVLAGGSLRSAAQAVPDAPHHVTLYGWTRTRPAFAKAVALAARLRNDALLDAALDLSREVTGASVGIDRARFAAMRLRFGQLNSGAKRRGAGER